MFNGIIFGLIVPKAASCKGNTFKAASAMYDASLVSDSLSRSSSKSYSCPVVKDPVVKGPIVKLSYKGPSCQGPSCQRKWLLGAHYQGK